MLIYIFYANLSNNLSYLMFKFLLVSLALFVLSACSKSTDEEITILPEEGIHDQNRPVIYVETGSRCVLQNQQTQSTSNPSLFTDWEGCETVVLNKAGSFATLPWQDGCSTTLSTTFRYNIKKTDGWQMAFHTFEPLLNNVGCSYICFYNSSTSQMKLFYFYDDSNGEFGVVDNVWYLHVIEVERPNLFSQITFAGLQPSYLSDELILLPVCNSADTHGMCHGWNGFEMNIPASVSEGNVQLCVCPVVKYDEVEGIAYYRQQKGTLPIAFSLQDVKSR